MTKYICKCGRRVSKSTNADNTGNRDTENCKGCPYLLPWGPFEHVPGQGFVRNVQGYECRMSPEISYATDYSGGADDKRTMAIHSLDLDFLEEVQAWIDEYADGQLSGRFSRDTIRGTDYCNKGRYSWSISCAQNKKGMAAKAALIERFFGPDKHRLDKTPEEEKAIVLAAIEAGKAKAQERKENMDYIISKHEATGRLYAYYKGSFWFWDSHIQRWLLSQFAEDLYQEERPKRRNFEREHFLAQTSDFHQLDDYEVPSRCIETLLQCNPKTAIPAPASAESPEIVDECSKPNCTCSDCKRQDCTCAGGCDASGRGKCDGEKNCAQDGCTYTAKHRENPTDAAPASLADAGAATQNLSGAEPASLEAPPSGSLAFDYSGLDDQTVADLHLAEREYSSGKKMAEMGLRRMADAVAIAHGAVVAICENGKDGKFSTHEDTFLRWCASVGLKKDSAYRMLQVSKLMDDSSPREQKVLEELSPSLLYAAAKPSAPAELVQAVKDGDITTHKQFKELEAQLKAEREAREKAEQDVEYFKKDSEDARKAAHAYHCKYDEANAQRNALLDEQGTYVSQITAAELRAEEAERRAQAAEAEVKSWEADGQKMQEIVDDQQAVIEEQKIRIGELESGITVEAAAVDREEIERRASELSEPLVKIIDQQNEQIERMASGNTVAAQASVLEQYLETMKASLLGNASRVELASYDIGALDSLARALREFADSIDGIFEDRSEDND
ncbi:hypothetical protein [Fournierella sp.]|uniref:hypothetical protein n=1 Tax=Allofournierella sp. TaxID=1940256 RepID=UPI0025C0E5FC|nr:hypothetical protein [Fournierella sp.]